MHAPADNFRDEYFFIKNRIREDLEDIAETAVHIIDNGSEEFLNKCVLAINRNGSYLDNSVSRLYFAIKKAFGTYKNKEQSHESYFDVMALNSGTSISSSELQIAETQIDMSAKFQTKHKNIHDFNYECNYKNNYSRNYVSCVQEIISSTKYLEIKQVATVLAGNLYNSCNIKTKKLRRLWKWDDRINYIKNMGLENISQEEKYEIKELQSALNKNNYLKRKRKDIYELLESYLNDLSSK